MANVQPKVVGEELSDARIKGFLSLTPHDGQNPDFYVLMKAYQGLRVHDFKRFIQFFLDASRDIHAKDQRSQTIIDVISSHRRSVDYVAVLQDALTSELR